MDEFVAGVGPPPEMPMELPTIHTEPTMKVQVLMESAVDMPSAARVEPDSRDKRADPLATARRQARPDAARGRTHGATLPGGRCVQDWKRRECSTARRRSTTW